MFSPIRHCCPHSNLAYCHGQWYHAVTLGEVSKEMFTENIRATSLGLNKNCYAINQDSRSPPFFLTNRNRITMICYQSLFAYYLGCKCLVDKRFESYDRQTLLKVWESMSQYLTSILLIVQRNWRASSQVGQTWQPSQHFSQHTIYEEAKYLMSNKCKSFSFVEGEIWNYSPTFWGYMWFSYHDGWWCL